MSKIMYIQLMGIQFFFPQIMIPFSFRCSIGSVTYNTFRFDR